MDRCPPTGTPSDTARRLAQLKRRLRTLQARYGDSAPDGLERLELAMARRISRVEHLRKRIGEMEAEAELLETELAGYRKGALLLLADSVATMEASHREGWSPVPVLGYRLWSVRPDGLWGVAVRWSTPRKAAECRTTGDSTDIPHSNGLCGRLGCGVYASKQLRPLFYERPPVGAGATAVGLVELTGKVVEHERGYRAERAEAVALVVTCGEEPWQSDDPARIALLFADPAECLDLRAARSPELAEWMRIEQHLEIEHRRYAEWT